MEKFSTESEKWKTLGKRESVTKWRKGCEREPGEYLCSFLIICFQLCNVTNALVSIYNRREMLEEENRLEQERKQKEAEEEARKEQERARLIEVRRSMKHSFTSRLVSKAFCYHLTYLYQPEAV